MKEKRETCSLSLLFGRCLDFNFFSQSANKTFSHQLNNNNYRLSIHIHIPEHKRTGGKKVLNLPNEKQALVVMNFVEPNTR